MIRTPNPRDDWPAYTALLERCEAWHTLADALSLRLYHLQIGKQSEPALLKLIRDLRRVLGEKDIQP